MASFKSNKLEIVGHFGVDSGQVLIVDPCYLHNITKTEYKEGKYGWVDGEFGEEDNSYDEACRITCNDEGIQAGMMSSISAVVSSTGWGDGNYPVYAIKTKEGRIGQLVIDFVGGIDGEE